YGVSGRQESKILERTQESLIDWILGVLSISKTEVFDDSQEFAFLKCSRFIFAFSRTKVESLRKK
ncbi:MAG: hypothetical protein KKA64_01280, partial [Nanoarchaeota archaeon]|nr:hypothetical protein [Nanoarchaeota archaeon]